MYWTQPVKHLFYFSLGLFNFFYQSVQKLPSRIIVIVCQILVGQKPSLSAEICRGIRNFVLVKVGFPSAVPVIFFGRAVTQGVDTADWKS